MYLKPSISSLLIALTTFTFTPGANAWDGVVTGKIAQLNGVGGSAGAPGNFDLRVVLENQSSLCSGSVDVGWAYINSNDANYKGLLAMLLMAQASSKTVTLYTTRDSTGRCQIGYLVLPS